MSLLTLAGAGPAGAADSIPFSDAQSIGTITLYDAAGHVVTHGSTSTSLRTEVARAVGSGPPPDGRVQGVYLSIWVPHAGGGDASAWSGAPLSLTTVLPASAKNLPATTQPLDVWPLDRDLIEASGPSTGAVAGYYELRLYGVNEGPDISPQYYTAAIKIDSSAHTWTMLNAPVPVPGQSGSGSSGSAGIGAAAPSGSSGMASATGSSPVAGRSSGAGAVAGSASGAAGGGAAGATAAGGARSGVAGASGSAAATESGSPQALALRSSSSSTSIGGPAAFAALFLAVDAGLLVRIRRRRDRYARPYRNGV